ncbi:type II secretion system F family protein [Anaerobacillus sp. MEB173]|uniref:type II secretion system F family protein n=1 Tax=Anaerobacillus sp. MEB173 TaxID=3383345 RepID=UPI003F9112A9
MQSYKFFARDNYGKRINGKMEAHSPLEIVRKLEGTGYTVTRVEEKKHDRNLFEKKVSLKELAVLCRQLSTMVRTGVPIIEALNTIGGLVKDKTLKQMLPQISEDIADGSTLAGAFEKHNNHLPPIFVNMLRSAEVSGDLDHTLNVLAENFQNDHKVRSKVKSALAYPIVIIIFANAMIFGLITFALPTFIGMFEGTDTPLPLITQILIVINRFITNQGIILFITLIILTVIGVKWGTTESGRRAIDYSLMKLPLVGDLVTKTVVYRFSQSLRDLYESGISVDESLAMTSKIVNHSYFSKSIDRAREEIRKGADIASSLDKSGLFPPVLISMLRVGENTGDLNTLLTDVATYSQRELEQKIDLFISLIEPILIVSIGIVVGGVIVGILLPMYDGMLLINK